MGWNGTEKKLKKKLKKKADSARTRIRIASKHTPPVRSSFTLASRFLFLSVASDSRRLPYTHTYTLKIQPSFKFADRASNRASSRAALLRPIRRLFITFYSPCILAGQEASWCAAEPSDRESNRHDIVHVSPVGVSVAALSPRDPFCLSPLYLILQSSCILAGQEASWCAG
jgi:hypothetical protein